MTNTKAVTILKCLWCYEKPEYTTDEIREALEIAIAALEIPCKDCNTQTTQRLIIRSNIVMKEEDAKKLRDTVMKQIETGVVILPPYCEAIYSAEDVQIQEEAE